MKKVDCNITDNFLHELTRMIDGQGFYFRGLLTNSELKQTVQEWSDAHPIKTRLDDLLEKYPDFHLDTNKYPMVLPRVFGYCDRYPSCDKCPLSLINGGYHKKCWDMPIENEEDNKS